MNILYINPFPLVYSSSGLYTKNLANYFLSHGHNILVVNIDSKEFDYDESFEIKTIIMNNENSFNFPCFTNHPHTDTTFYSLNLSQIKLYENTIREQLKDIIDDFAPDIIHSQYIWLSSAIASDFKDIPSITTSFGSELYAYNKDIRYKEYVDKAIENSRFIIAPSKNIEIELRKLFTLDSVKLKLIYKGFDDSIYNFIDGKQKTFREYFNVNAKFKYIVLYNDILNHMKGIDVFLNTAEKIIENRDDICFIIVGDGDYRREVQDKANNSNGAILYFSKITEEEKPYLLHITDITVIPSRFAPFGVNALESFAMGTPVIASKIGELQYFVNSENGRLIEDMNTDNLLKTILELIDSNFKEKCSLFCYQFAVRNYSKSTLNNLILKLYEYAMFEK